ncbi:MAG: choice-of-anchor L domain-containing protein, partial [Bacteroidales bacterium]|nr:choice-of-anchor L domain-containing protein [Bacteroidales bacterium]
MKDRIFNSLTLLCTVLLLTTLSGYAQSFSVQTVNLTAQQLVDSMLKGEGVSITNAQFNRSTGVVGNNIGIFHNLNLYSSSDFYQRSAVNWPLGIIMTTGAISAATGGDIGTSNKVPTDAAVDPDLVPLTPNPVKSLTLLEFDFIANSASIKFEYIFASKEYPNYVYQSFNDIFAFHITGRNPVTFANNWKTNIALVPNSIPPLPVTVGNGNNGNSGGGGNELTV